MKHVFRSPESKRYAQGDLEEEEVKGGVRGKVHVSLRKRGGGKKERF